VPTITSIEQQRRGGRVTIFADGAPWLAVGRDVVLAHGLRRGDEASPELFERLSAADAGHRAYEAALLLLSYRPRAESELRQRLHRKGLPEQAIDEAVARLRRAGLVDDESFARAWTASRGQGASALGPQRLRAELRRKGVAADIVQQALEAETGEGGEDAAALDVALVRARTLRGVPYPEFRRRLGAFLQRRGFGYEAVNRALREAWRTAGSEEEDADGGA
jgi:regulatory protein